MFNSISASSSSQSEGDYVIASDDIENSMTDSPKETADRLSLSPSDVESQTETIGSMDEPPVFSFAEWSPEPPPGIKFLNLLPSNKGYDVGKEESQHSTVGKIRMAAQAKKHKRKDFLHGKSVGRDVYDSRRLRQAVGEGNFTLVETLLDDGVDPCSVDDKRRSALHIAAAHGDPSMVSLLLNQGADPNQRDILGNTALHLAACTHHVPVVTLLLRAGTDVNALDNCGNTPLHLARSRLRLIQEDLKTSSDMLKGQVTHIVAMMKEYLNRSGQQEDMGELDRLCDRLQQTTTRQELDAVGSLLTDFTSLQIEKRDTPG